MKLPSAIDIVVVVAVLTGVQVLFASIPESQVWWAPAVSAGLLASLQAMQVLMQQPQTPDVAPPGVAAAPMPTAPESKMKQWLLD